VRIALLVRQYVDYRRSFGQKFLNGACRLNALAKAVGPDSEPTSLNADSCRKFLYGDGVKASLFPTSSALRGFLEWLVARGHLGRTPVLPPLPRRVEHVRPYIYTRDEIKRLLKASLSYQKHTSVTYPENVRFAIFLTYALGLRIHETLAIKLKDVETDRSLVAIRESKFYKSRLLPYGRDVAREMDRFLRWRTSRGLPSGPEDLLFLNARHEPMRYGNFRATFRKLCDAVGIRRTDGAAFGPRIHDLRHTFAVSRLTEWYRDGRDVQRLLPALSTYLGHAHVSDTSVYLTMTPEILREAGLRFERFCKHGEGGNEAKPR